MYDVITIFNNAYSVSGCKFSTVRWVLRRVSPYSVIGYMISAQDSNNIGSLQLEGETGLILFRKQETVWKWDNSYTLPANCVGPQGSLLGPLLFFIVINDLPSLMNVFKLILFADDSTMSIVINPLINLM